MAKAKKSSKKGSGLTGNNLSAMLLKLAVVLGLFFLSRVAFYLLNLHYFAQIGFGELMKILFFGLRFDLSAILILNTPFILLNLLPFRFKLNKGWQTGANIYYYVVNTIGLMSNLIDLIYFRFTLKRTTADIFKYLGVGGDFDKLVPQFLKDFWYVLLLFILFVTVMIWLGRKFSASATGAGGKGTFGWYALHTFLFLAGSALTVIGIRGGLQLRPIGIITAGTYTSAKNVPLILNTPFSIARTIGNETLVIRNYFKNEKELASVYTPVHKGKPAEPKNLNVVIFILESFSLEHIGSLNRDADNGRYQGFTPFLDSLIGHSLVYKGFANGKTSIQGIPAILSGIPSLMNESFIQSNYSNDKVNSMAGLLKQKGFSSAFFHGGTNGTMGFDAYTRYAGFDRYFGRTEYGNEKDYDGEWGIRDEEFFQYAAKRMEELKPPFLSAIFTLSSHHPYRVPGKYAHTFRKGKLPIQEAVMYSDFSLKRFFETARQMPWFENTLFILTADHTSEGYFPYYQTNTGQFAIPVIFYRPDGSLKGQPDLIAQQTDIMPSVLDYLGYDKDFIAFGNSLFDTTATRFSVHYISGIYSLIMDGHVLEFDGTESRALYDLTADPLQKTNIIGQSAAVRKEMEHFLRAYIQQYNNRVIENRLSTE